MHDRPPTQPQSPALEPYRPFGGVEEPFVRDSVYPSAPAHGEMLPQYVREHGLPNVQIGRAALSPLPEPEATPEAAQLQAATNQAHQEHSVPANPPEATPETQSDATSAPLHTDKAPQAEAQVDRPNPELSQIKEQVKPLLALQGKEAASAANDFVRQRVAELSDASHTIAVGNSYPDTDEFIPPEAKSVAASFFDKPYHFDDLEAYTAALPAIQRVYGELKATTADDDQAYLNAVVHGANEGQVVYFGSYHGDTEARAQIVQDTIEYDNPTPAPLSVANLKGVAECQERAGVAHNTLQIFGVDSTFHAGTLTDTDAEGVQHTGTHAFLTFTNTVGEQYIFDPTNPVLVRNENEVVIVARPALYKLDPNHQGSQQAQVKSFHFADGALMPDPPQTVTYDFKVANPHNQP
jgi:hypothetical protein